MYHLLPRHEGPRTSEPLQFQSPDTLSRKLPFAQGRLPSTRVGFALFVKCLSKLGDLLLSKLQQLCLRGPSLTCRRDPQFRCGTPNYGERGQSLLKIACRYRRGQYSIDEKLLVARCA